jgi:hypothetical protein
MDQQNLLTLQQNLLNLLPIVYRNQPNAIATTTLVANAALCPVTAAPDMAASAMVVGQVYTITSQGTYPFFTAAGAPDNNVGTTFTCTGGVGTSGTGTVAQYQFNGQLLLDQIRQAYNWNVDIAGPNCTGVNLDVVGKYIGLARDIYPVISATPLFQFGDYNDPAPPGATGAGIPVTPNNGSAIDFPNGMTDYNGSGVPSTFASYVNQGASVTTLDDQSYALLMLIKAYTNTMSGSLYEIQDFLENGLAGTPLAGMITVTDTQGDAVPGPVMELTYYVNAAFLLQNSQGTGTTASTQAILAQYLPRPLGVGITITASDYPGERVLMDDVSPRVLGDGTSFRVIGG